MANLRTARDAQLSKTDYLLLADSNLTDVETEVVITYRMALRDLPSLYTAETVSEAVLPEITGTPEFMARLGHG
tara:strand:- start:68 stop:289 length:222 start_codon:yes stop_codon:yes gene_type:complete